MSINPKFTNDKYPRTEKYPDEFQPILIKKGASIVANSTILGGVSFGENAMIRAWILFTKTVPDGKLWFGNHSRFMIKI